MYKTTRIEKGNMTLKNLFKQENEINIPKNLYQQVVFCVEQAIEKKKRQDQIVWGGLFLASLGIFVASAIHTTLVITRSSFGNYFSLIFTDSATALTLWKQIILSLIESLPFIEICIVLTSVAVVLWSIRNFSKSSPLFITHTNASLA